MVHDQFNDKAFRKFCAEYEFQKKSTFREAHRNISEMLVSTKAPPVEQQWNLVSLMKKVVSGRGVKTMRSPEERIEECTEADSDGDSIPDSHQYFNVDFQLTELEEFYEEFHLNEFTKNRKWKCTNEKVMFEEASIFERFSLRDGSSKYNTLIREREFPLSMITVTRAYGKVKLLMSHRKTEYDRRNKISRKDADVEYWRCRKGTTFVWKGFYAKFEPFERFQLCAAIDLFDVVNQTPIETLRRKRLIDGILKSIHSSNFSYDSVVIFPKAWPKSHT
ncbi:hypothetical protein B9Z55_012503 [Caenorhabditis nigoni]|uniref:Uncharacterized protein n=1 Tax=Caenorhabditis nigoni TaxID=1611254 RepID=A0A2G5TXG8_9PELO|nr:hypothetical protein B9Z55_012503 [Caenorhabditis nigoni]